MTNFLHLDACIYPRITPELMTDSTERYWYHQKKLVICISLMIAAVLLAITAGAIFGSRSTIHSAGTLLKHLDQINYCMQKF